jgi:iron complex outermembrane receptor protein
MTGNFGAHLEQHHPGIPPGRSTDRLDWLVGVFATQEQVDRFDTFFLGADYAPLLSFQLSAALNAAVPAFPVSPGIIPCFTRTAQTALGLQQCLGTGGAVSGGGPTLAAGQTMRDVYEQESTSVALFTNNTFSLTDQFDITVGLRYTWDEKTLDGAQRNVGANQLTCAAALGNAAVINGVLGAASGGSILARHCLPWTNPFYNNRNISESVSEDNLSGTIKASYRLNESVLAYVSYARGYKSFGYNQDRVQNGVTPVNSLFFPSEEVDSYEFGVKMTLLDRTMLLNATYFDQTFDRTSSSTPSSAPPSWWNRSLS